MNIFKNLLIRSVFMTGIGILLGSFTLGIAWLIDYASRYPVP